MMETVQVNSYPLMPFISRCSEVVREHKFNCVYVKSSRARRVDIHFCLNVLWAMYGDEKWALNKTISNVFATVKEFLKKIKNQKVGNTIFLPTSFFFDLTRSYQKSIALERIFNVLRGQGVYNVLVSVPEVGMLPKFIGDILHSQILTYSILGKDVGVYDWYKLEHTYNKKTDMNYMTTKLIFQNIPFPLVNTKLKVRYAKKMKEDPNIIDKIRLGLF